MGGNSLRAQSFRPCTVLGLSGRRTEARIETPGVKTVFPQELETRFNHGLTLPEKHEAEVNLPSQNLP